MMKLDNETGTITCFQGDSGKFFLSGLPVSCNVYFSVYNENKKILNEQQYSANSSGELKMFIPAEFTDVLVVPKDEEYVEHYYSIKLVYTDDDFNRVESTCLISGHDIDNPNVIRVYPKRTEGGTVKRTEGGTSNAN